MNSESNTRPVVELKRGEHVRISGTSRTGDPIEVTGYVVIVNRVAPDNVTMPGPDAPRAVTVNEATDETGQESAVIVPADAVATLTGEPNGSRYYGH